MAISLGDLTKISLGKATNKRLKQEYTEIAKDGIYYTYDNGAMSVTHKQHGIPEGILKGSLASTIDESFQLEERIPFRVFLQIIQFYHDVVRTNTTEASVLIYRNVNNVEIPQEFKDEFNQAIMEVGQFVVLVPNQVNSHGHTQFANFNGSVDESVHTWFESNMVGVLETHSHCNFNAFWSGTDDRFEKHSKLRSFMVIGNNTRDVALKMRYSYNYNYFDDIDFHDLFTETEVYEEKKITNSIIAKGLESFINFFKGTSEEKVTTRTLTWKDVINELDLDDQPVTYPKEDWFARIQARPTYNYKNYNVLDESTLADGYEAGGKNSYLYGSEYEDLEQEELEELENQEYQEELEEEYEEELEEELEEEEYEEDQDQELVADLKESHGHRHGYVGVIDNFFGNAATYGVGRKKNKKY